MVSVPPAVALAALGEAVTVTPKTPPDAPPVPLRGVVQRELNYTEDANGLRTAILSLAAAPTVFAEGDAVAMRGRNWIINSRRYPDDAAWVEYILQAN